MRKMPLFIPLMVFLFAASGQVCSQITVTVKTAQKSLTAKVTQVSGETFTIDSGKNSGLVEGLQGKVSYMETLEGNQVRIDIAFAEIQSVENSSSRLKTQKKTDEIKEGYSIDITAGTLSISSAPEGVDVSMDNDSVTKTPLSNRIVAFDSHTINVKKDEYEPLTRNITVTENAPGELSFQLVPLFSLVSVDKTLSGAEVDIDGDSIGNPPVSNKRISPGSYTLTIKLMGYEDYKKSLVLEKGKTTEISLPMDIIPKTKSKVIRKSLVFPGRGQRYADYKGKGTLFTLLQVATIGGAVGTSMMSMKAIDEYNNARTAYRNATTKSTIDYTAQDAQDKYDKSSSAHSLQMAAIGAAAAVYLWNVIDAAMTSPRVEVNPRFGSVDITPSFDREYYGFSVSMRL